MGVLENGEGPRVLFRADIDALPVKENTGLPNASTKSDVDAEGDTVPLMHAGGHDMHIVAGLGAANLLAENKAAWSGIYIALFQPAEETGGGTQAMADDGLVNKIPKPDVALGRQVLTVPAAGEAFVIEAMTTAVSRTRSVSSLRVKRPSRTQRFA